MSYRLAESLEKFRAQINALFPQRSKVSDGWIGDASHQSRSSASDHNPWIIDNKGVGVVTALDITFDTSPADGIGIDCHDLARVLVKNKDARIKYLIWNRQIVSSAKQPWIWREYTGANAHTKHLHISVMPIQTLYDDVRDWKLDFNSIEIKPVPAGEFYTIKPGDNLTKISQVYRTTVTELMELNYLKTDVIHPGKVLRVK